MSFLWVLIFAVVVESSIATVNSQKTCRRASERASRFHQRWTCRGCCCCPHRGTVHCRSCTPLLLLLLYNFAIWSFCFGEFACGNYFGSCCGGCVRWTQVIQVFCKNLLEWRAAVLFFTSSSRIGDCFTFQDEEKTSQTLRWMVVIWTIIYRRNGWFLWCMTTSKVLFNQFKNR